MIADLSDHRFEMGVFSRKIEYNQGKIEKGVGELLFTSLDAKSLEEFKDISELVASANERVKLPYHEVTLSLPEGEHLTNEQFKDIAIDYLKRLGAGDTSFAIIRHTDKPHEHVHVLFTTVDTNGKWVDDYLERVRSQAISREIELEYGLKVTEYKQAQNFSLSEIKAREYYYHKALSKGLKSYATKTTLNNLLENSGFKTDDFRKKARTNEEYQLLLGDSIYKQVGFILEDNGMYRPLYKDELLENLDRIYDTSKSFNEFRQNLEKENIYMRFLTDKGTSKYVYGLPDVPIYFNDKSLPQKYRYGYLFIEDKKRYKQEEILVPENKKDRLKGETVQNNIPIDEQKHMIYNMAFLSLNKAHSYEEFKNIMKAANIELNEHRNTRGIYGLSFTLTNVDNAHVFKASDISRRLSYNSINSYYLSNKSDVSTDLSKQISPVANNSAIINHMYQDITEQDPRAVDTNNRDIQEDDMSLLSTKRRKKKGRERY